MDDLEEIGVLGEGACGRVKLCVHRSSTKPYAVKIMKKRNVLESMQVEMVCAASPAAAAAAPTQTSSLRPLPGSPHP